MLKLKYCSGCKQYKPATNEYFYRNRSTKDGLATTCILCRKLLYKQNKEYYKKYFKKWRKNNPDKIRRYDRKYYTKQKHGNTESSKRWREEHPNYMRKYLKQWRKDNPDKNREYGRRWYKNHKSKAKANAHNRRTALLNAEGGFSGSDVMKQYRLQDEKCFYCGCDLNYEFHVDHYVPLSKGGTNWPENIVCACPSCNLRKNNKMPEDFIKELNSD